MKKISIIIPAFNEAESLPVLFEQLTLFINKEHFYKWEIIFVNDGSTDNTILLVGQYHSLDNRYNFVDLSRNFGKEIAVIAGMDYATGDCVIIMDADLQHPLSVIPEMIKEWENGYENVYATRNLDNKENYFKRTFSRIYYRILKKLVKTQIPQNTGDFRLLDKKCVEAFKRMRESQRNNKALFSLLGFKEKQVFYVQDIRKYGVTKWKFLALINLAIDGITSFTTAPLRISTVVGFIISVFSFLYMIFIISKTIIYGDPVKGFPTLIVIILFLGGIQLLSLGIIGEYLGRIFYETKNRPLYFINSYNGIKESDKV